ncbi:MAG: M48 family metallopeptidase [Tannerella sp.]|jgi:predicted metal-dependent hydrolase|nr:M48 family metallopeptidase [Tannerella sp.]
MVEYKKIEAGDLGIVFLRRNPCARRYLLRVENGHVYATIPAYGNERELLSFLNEQHDRLLHILQKASKRLMFDENTEFRTYTFSLQIIRSSLDNIYSTLREDVLYISCPLQTDFSDEQIQEKLRKIIENTLRYEAKRILPVRLKELAEKHGFQYTSVKINNSRTHWGSCTARKSINLSLSVMLLPEHLLDYILLHELCHTVEMNHGERFWSLMNKVTDGKVARFRKEMKSYRML